METQNNPSETVIEGYVAVWGDEAKLGNGLVTEIIGKDCFTYDDVVALYGHDRQSIPLGRLGAKTLELKKDDHGLYAKFTVPKSRPDLAEAAELGNITGWSFDINSPQYKWQGNRGTLTKTKLTEITLTPFPQYKKTTLKVTKK